MTSLLFIIAALNEEKGVGLTLSELRSVLGDQFFLVVDGNSGDRTVEVARECKAEVMVQSVDEGKGAALAQGLEYVRESRLEPDYLALIDADYTYPAEHVPSMVRVLESDPTVGMVIGNRFDESFNYRRAIASKFYFGNRFLAYMHNMLNGVDLRDPLSGLRVARWDVLRGWRPRSKSFDVEVEMNYYVEKMGYRIAEVPIQYRPRMGEKKLKLRHGLTIFKRIVGENLNSHKASLSMLRRPSA